MGSDMQMSTHRHWTEKEMQDQLSLVSWGGNRGDATIGVCPGSSSTENRSRDKDVSAGVLFGEETPGGRREGMRGWALGGQKPIKGGLLSCGQLGLGTSGALQNCLSRA